MKKIINTTITVIITLAIVCAGIAIYMHFTKSDEKQNINSIKPGEIVSEKYGTFVIPEENMFFALNMGMVYAPNNTDFTYLFDEYMDEMARINKVEDVAKFKEDNQALLAVGPTPEHGQTVTDMINEPNYPYLNSTAYANDFRNSPGLCLLLQDNILKYDVQKLVEYNYKMPYVNCKPIYTSKEILENAVDGMVKGLYSSSYEEDLYLNIAVRCLGRKVTMSVEGQDDITYIVPVMIISDKGYPMTEKVYEEIKKGI